MAEPDPRFTAALAQAIDEGDDLTVARMLGEVAGEEIPGLSPEEREEIGAAVAAMVTGGARGSNEDR